MKKILVVGGGGREHALVWKLAASPKVEKVFCAPGNAGISSQAECVDISAEDIHGLAAFAEKEGIDLTVVGPEGALTLGIVDVFTERGMAICGPTASAAELEGSKAFSKDFMKKYTIPTAAYRTFTDSDEAKRYVREQGAPITVKASGLAAGKGVILAMTEAEAIKAIDDIMTKKSFGDAGDTVVVEEFLRGEEASFIVFTDGKTIVPLPTSQDHKAVYDGDRGPNTGGMGAYSPAPVVTPELSDKIMSTVMVPTIEGMAKEGRPYKGFLYAGLMINDGELSVLEFNARMGDPETQPLLIRMKNDLFDVLEAIVAETLDSVDVLWDERASVCVVMASSGYPGSYEKGKTITGLDACEGLADTVVFHAGTALKDGRIVTSGGRVLGVTALGMTVKEAIEKSYEATAKITWDGVYYRKDIGKKALVR